MPESEGRRGGDFDDYGDPCSNCMSCPPHSDEVSTLAFGIGLLMLLIIVMGLWTVLSQGCKLCI
jgi:hypothetical protein